MFSFQGTVLRPTDAPVTGSYLRQLALPTGDGEIRTLDPLLARQVLSQLSYTPIDLAATYVPVPFPAKYFRPLRS